MRERGRAVGQAVTEVYPDIVLFFIFGIGLNAEHQELLIPFVDGILETAGPLVTVHDGGERGYPQMLYSSFKKLREDADRTGRGHSAILDVFEQRIRHGFGIWVDPNTSSYGGFHTDDLSKNHKDGPEFEHTLYNALTVSDKYVWLYVWHPILWWAPNLEQHTMCQLCPHKELPKPYLEAIVNCRKPHDLGWTPPKKDNP